MHKYKKIKPVKSTDERRLSSDIQPDPRQAKKPSTNVSLPDINRLPETPQFKTIKDTRPKPFAFASKSGYSKGQVRVRLPTIESYERELEFQCEGPGRVVVRLERLMGSNRVRINDPKYMRTLLSKLEEEEDKIWHQRKIARRKAERDRFRQLVIEGKMEPTPDMKGLLKHPVFRVNRIFNRLASMDASLVLDSDSGIGRKPAALTPCEPFHASDYMNDGILFGDHIEHYRRTDKDDSDFGILSDHRKSQITLPMLRQFKSFSKLSNPKGKAWK